MVTKVISELKSVFRLKILPETGPWFSVLWFPQLVPYFVVPSVNHCNKRHLI